MFTVMYVICDRNAQIIRLMAAPSPKILMRSYITRVLARAPLLTTAAATADRVVNEEGGKADV